MGIWEPHSSSVDFCEPNYYVTDTIAEPYNAFSSLLLTIPCFAGLSFFGGNPTGEIRNDFMYGILIAIGFGSFLLHGTLNWIGQSLDEVPMLWMTLTYIYCLVELNAPKGLQRVVNLEKYLGAFAVVQTLIYFYLRGIYWVFLVIYTSTVVVVRQPVVFRCRITIKHANLNVSAQPSCENVSARKSASICPVSQPVRFISDFVVPLTSLFADNPVVGIAGIFLHESQPRRAAQVPLHLRLLQLRPRRCGPVGVGDELLLLLAPLLPARRRRDLPRPVARRLRLWRVPAQPLPHRVQVSRRRPIAKERGRAASRRRLSGTAARERRRPQSRFGEGWDIVIEV